MTTAELARFDTMDEARAYVMGAHESNAEIKGKLVIYTEDDGTYTVNID